MRRLATLLVFAIGCGPPPPAAIEESYQRAVAALRQGSLRQALEEARRGEKRCPPDSGCFWKFRLLEAEVLFYRGEESAALAILSVRVPPAIESEGLEVRRRTLQGMVFLRRAPDQSDRLLQEAHQEASRLALPEQLLDIELLQGLRHFGSNRPGEARAQFLATRQQAAARGDAYHEAASLVNLGMLSARQSRFDEAIPWFLSAVEKARQVDARPLMGAALNNLAMCYTQLGAFDDAIQRRHEANLWLGAGEVKATRRDGLGETGLTYALQGDGPKSIAYFRQALAVAREMSNAGETARWAGNLSEALAAAGEWDAAELANREELALAQDAGSKAQARLNVAVIAAGRGRRDEAIAHYQRAIEAAAGVPAVLWASYAGLGRVYSAAGNRTLAQLNFEKALAIIDRNRSELSRDEYKMTFLARLIRFYQDYVEVLMERGASGQALQVAESSRARILAEKLAPAAATRRLTLRDYQAYARQSGSVLLSYWLAPRQSWVWVVSPARVQSFRLPPAREIGAWVDEYRAFVERNGRDPMKRDSPAGRKLYEVLIAPVARSIPAGGRVVLVPDGPLHGLNFETLPVYGDEPHYWIDEVTVSIAPSLDLVAGGPVMKGAPPRSLLIIGDALYTGKEYPKLPDASVEIERIERRFGPAKKTVITGAAASPEAYRQAGPEGFSLIHFSAHADANPRSPLDSAIILSPGTDRFKLYARDVMEVPLRADLVTISACRSAGARAYSGEGLVGFAWAFLRAGARHVIAGLWDVTDSFTPAMMDAFYGGLEAGQRPVEALRAAKLTMIHSQGPYAKPYYWGPFQIYIR